MSGNDEKIVLGLIGHPLTHSLSAKMHTHALSCSGIDGEYVNIDIPSADGIADVIRERRMRGVNVTVPYKCDAVGQMDSLDASAERTGAVNTILNDGGKLIGYNTDIEGARFAFEKAGIKMYGGMKVLIMGSGGAARACCSMFSDAGADISIIGRNTDTVRSLCSMFGCTPVTDKDPSGYDTVVNCTPVGMYSSEEYPADITELKEGQTVFDVTYGTDSDIARTAKNRGCIMVSGLDMLIGQGIRSFEIWTGKRPSYETMKEALQ